MGWGREEIVRESLSPSGSPVEQPPMRMSTVKRLPNYQPEWLNDDNAGCPLLRPVFQAMSAPSNITIPELTITGNPFAHPIEQGQPETLQEVSAQISIPPSAGDTALTLGTYAVETSPQGTAATLASNLNPNNLPVWSTAMSQSLEQMDLVSDRKSSFTPPIRTPTLPLTIPPVQSTPNRPMPSFQAFLAARQQQRDLSANTPAAKATTSKTRTYLAGLNREYQDHLINIQQLMTYANTYRQSWHYVVGLYIQIFRDPSTFPVAPHFWEKDAWKADMLEKNPASFLTCPDPAHGSIEHNIMEQLRGSELKRQAMEAAIVEWSHRCQPQEVINVMSKVGWTRRSEYVFGANWSVMDTIKRMDEGPEKMSLLAKAQRESPLFFKKCIEDEMCGR